MLLIIFILGNIGYALNQKFFPNFKYNVLSGFLLITSVFQIISFPFLWYQTSFSLFIMIIAPIVLIIFGTSLYLNKLSYFKHIYQQKTNPIYLLVFGLALIVINSSLLNSDSWLYSALINSTIKNNIIYSSDGKVFMGHLNMFHHRFDSYYLFQAVIAKFSFGETINFLLSYYKILDSFLIISALFALAETFLNKKYKHFLFVVMYLFAGIDTELNIAVLQTTEISNQLLQLSTGTSLLHLVYYPLLFAFFIKRNEMSDKMQIGFGSLLVLSFTAATNSAVYTLPLYFAAVIVYDLLTQKTKSIPAITLFSLTLTSSILQQAFFKFSEPVALGVTLVFAAILIGANIGMRKISFIGYDYLIKGLLVIYFFVSLILFNFSTYFSYNSSVNFQKIINRVYIGLSTIGSESIDWYRLLFLVTLAVLFFFTFKTKNSKIKALFTYSIIFIVLFAMPLADGIYIRLSIEPVISRINELSAVSFVLILALLDRMNLNYVVAIVAGLLLVWMQGAYERIDDYMVAKQNFQVQYQELIAPLIEHDFEPNSIVVVDSLDVSPSVGVFYVGINKLVVFVPDLSLTYDYNTCEEVVDSGFGESYDYCYTIYENDKFDFNQSKTIDIKTGELTVTKEQL